MQRWVGVMVVLPVVLAAGCAETLTEPSPRIAVSTSYLGAAVRDVLDEEVPLVKLSGPGTCPGHFDITPGHLVRLRRCRLLLRFDFQRHFDAKLQAAVEDGLEIVAVRESGGLCEPATYRAACGVVADALVQKGFLRRSAAGVRLRQIESRLAALAAAVRARVRGAGLEGAPVVAAHHQAGFCRWLGLKVAAEFIASDAPAALNRAVGAGQSKGVRLIIGNSPQGRVIPDRLAQALGARVVMFRNFPSADAGREAFDALVRDNVARLHAEGA